MRWIFGFVGAGLLALLTIAGSDRLFVKAVPLEQRLVSANEVIRKKAQQDVLGLGGDDKRRLTPRLIPLLSASDPFARKWSAIAIALIGPSGQEAIPALLHGVSDPENEVAQACRVALSEIGRPDAQQLPILLQGLRDAQEAVRCEAAAGLSKMGPEAKEALPILIEQLHAPQAPECIVEGTALLVSEMPEQLNTVTALLQDADALVRRRAAHVLAAIPHKAPLVLETLLNVLANDPDARTRWRAARGLGLLQPPDRGVIPTLVYTSLHAKKEEIRLAALQDLRQAALPPVERARTLRRILAQDESPDLRRSAAQGLVELGPAARPATNQLIQALKDPDEQVRQSALLALRGLPLRGREWLSPVAHLQKDSVAEVRCLAAEELVEMGAWDRVNVGMLAADLSTTPDALCDVEALSMAGHFNREVVPALIKLLQAGASEGRRRAAYVLMNLGARAKDALPALAQAQRDGIPGAQTALRAIREATTPERRRRR